MKVARRKRNIPMTIAGVLLCLTLVSVWLMSGLYARYTTSDSASDSARVAAFVFDVSDTNNTHMIDISGIQKPGDTETYAFIVKNSNGSAISEVSETYTITVALNGSMPLTATLNKADSDLFTVSTTATGSGSNSTTGAFTPGNSSANRDTYALTVTWPSTNPYPADTYANGTGMATVTLTVTGMQAD